MRGRLAAPVAAALLGPATGAAQDGDAARGERVFQYCYSCHSVVPGESGLQGPNLAGILGRRIAADDFAYSAAMRAFAAREPVWTPALLDRFVAAPEAVVPRTSMEFRGVEDDAERADLLAYLEAASEPRD